MVRAIWLTGPVPSPVPALPSADPRASGALAFALPGASAFKHARGASPRAGGLSRRQAPAQDALLERHARLAAVALDAGALTRERPR